MKRETYPQARERLFRELKALGFEVKDNLKLPSFKWLVAYKARPHTPAEAFKTLVGIMGNPETRTVYFHKQAVYLDELSMYIDIRGMSCDTFLAMVADCHEKWSKIGR